MSGRILQRFTGTIFSLAMLAIIVLALSGSASAAGYPGHVYTETNAASGNQVLVYGRAADGSLTYWAGGGITRRSDPAREWAELFLKTRALTG